ncbi:hypothetical protein EDD85DRAFT_793560 [Armillaria nabsnona]|nr:hypothetical protein EDD85DRAFT_793560 [Armillaria nabsnona]
MLDQECGFPSCTSVARRAPPLQGQFEGLAVFEGLYPYNLDASDPDDLSFAAGDIITIVEETNADWWLGEHNGCKTLPRELCREDRRTQEEDPYPQLPRRRKTGTNSIGLQQDPGQDGKKSKFGKYGNTMAHSATGGVGFGASAAIGGGLVRAIF